MKGAKPRARGVFEFDGGLWIRFKDLENRDHVRRLETLSVRDAISIRAAVLTDIKRKKFDPARRVPTVSEFIEEYLEGEKHVSRDYVHLKHHGDVWKAELGHLPLTSVRPSQVDKWTKRRLGDGASPATVNRAVTFLRRILSLAVRDGVLDRHPLASIKKLRENNARVRYLTEKEEQALFRHLTSQWHPHAILAIETGLRLSEMLGLTRAGCDFAAGENGIITVARSKHGESRRVPMRPAVRETLQALLAKHDSPWLFPSPQAGRHVIRSSGLRKAFEKAVKAAKIPDFHWHDLRHSFASRLAMAGVDLYTIMELMGHKTIQMTMRYAHLSPKYLEGAINRPLPPDRYGGSESGSDASSTATRR